MKKQIFILFLFSIVFSYAQPVINSNDFLPVEGETYKIYSFSDAVTGSYDGSGSTEFYFNDISNYFTEDSFDIEVIDPESSFYFSNYNTSNVCLRTADEYGNVFYHYNKYDDIADDYSELGYQNELNKHYFDEDRLFLEFPLQMGAQFSDDYIHYYYDSEIAELGYSETGSFTAEVIAYGNYHIDDITYTDVLELKVIDIYSRYSYFTGNTSVHEKHIHYFFKQGVHYPILKFEVVLTDFESYISGQYSPSIYTGLNSFRDLSCNVFYNQINNQIVIENLNTNKSNNHIFIADIYGRSCLETITGQDRVIFDSSGLSPGLYLVTVINGANRITKKVIVY